MRTPATSTCISPCWLSAILLLVEIFPVFSGSVCAGGHWSRIGPDEESIQTLAVDPLTPSTLFAGTGRGIFRSSDSGRSWKAVNSGLGGHTDVGALAVAPVTPSIVYAAVGNRLFRSRDGGESWHEISDGMSTRDTVTLAINPVTPSILYAGTSGDGMYRSLDGGDNWHAINNGVTQSYVQALAIDPLNPSNLYAAIRDYAGNDCGVFRTRNGGDSWARTEPIPRNPCFVTLGINPANPSILYAGSHSVGVFRSLNGGDTWEAINDGLIGSEGYVSYHIAELVVDPQDPSNIYIGTLGDGLFRSANGGDSWYAINEGLTEPDVRALAIDPLNPSTLYAGTYWGIFRTADGGNSWEARNNGLHGPYRSVPVFAFDPLNPSTLYVGVHYYQDGGMFRSRDGGETWAPINKGLAHHYLEIQSLAIDPLRPSTLYIGTGRGVFRSMDSGESWEAANNGLSTPNSGAYSIKALAIDPLNSSIVYAGTKRQGVFLSTDGGETWTPSNSGLHLPYLEVRVIVIDPLDPSTLYVGTEGGVFRSTNGGNGWYAVNEGLISSVHGSSSVWGLVIDPLAPSNLYVSTGAGVFRSMNSGNDWTQIDDGLPYDYYGVLAIDPLTPANLYVGIDDEVFHSADGGDSWLSLASSSLRDVSVTALKTHPLTPSTIYAGTVEGLFVYRPELFFPQIADGTAGTLQFQSTLILVNTGPDGPVRVELYQSPDGEPMALKLGELGTDSVFEFQLKNGESISLPTPGTAEPQVGYARVVSSHEMGGVIVFRRTDLATGISYYETGVPASDRLSKFTLFVDSLGTRDTGFAMVFPQLREQTYLMSHQTAWVTMRLYDQEYNFIATETLRTLEQGSHLAKYVHELFDDPDVKAEAREMQGILEVESSQPLVAVTVRQNDDPAREFPEEVPFLTTFPVIPGIAGDANPVESDPSTFYFPQLGDGVAGTLQFQSTLILSNTGSDTSVRVELYSSPDGQPMTLTLGELGTDSVFEFELKQGESISLTTPGTGSMQVGYARVVAGQEVGGVVVFRRTDLATGISFYEAGVPASQKSKEFSLFVDSIGVRDTGFALVYPPEEGISPALIPDANVTLRLYDKQYSLIAERTLEPIAPGTHLARFVHEMFDDPTVKEQAQEMEGILVIESDQPLVAVTVRQNDDPTKEFPDEVPILTTFPAITGAPN